MKTNPLLFTCIILLLGYFPANSQDKVVVPLSDDGAWAVNSQPSAVYYNQNFYFAWVNQDKSLVAASYNPTSGVYKEKIVASGFRGDFASPALLVRDNGQLLLFSSKNEGESHYYVWVTTNPEDITSWSASKNGIAYGAGATLPFAIGDDVYVLYRNKNSVGINLATGLNVSTEQTVEADLSNRYKRAGIFGTGNGNDRNVRLDIPYMRACQDANGAIHIVFTQLATGGVSGNTYYNYNKGVMHYMKLVGTSTTSKLSFNLFKADGTEIIKADIDPASPPDIIYSEAVSNKKAWAYDIELDANGNPVVLYATFNADGTAHTYNQAKWNNTTNQWVNSTITTAGAGLATTAYSTYLASFPAHAYSSGGINFAAKDLSTVYLSKRNEEDVFEIYKYTTSDSGATWVEAEALTSGTSSNMVNIRPKRVENAPKNAPIDIIWMQGSYTSPVNYSTAIMCQGSAVSPTAMAFEKEEYNVVVGSTSYLSVNFSPIFVADRGFTLESGNPSIIEITTDNKIKCLATGTVTITARSSSNPSLTTTCQVVVKERLVFDVFKERIVADLFSERVSDITQLDTDVDSYLALLQTNGSFSDVNYASTVRTNWPPQDHLDRLLYMTLAYTSETSRYFENEALKTNMDLMLQYWQDTKPHSNNWWYNQIAEPQRMGQLLVVMDYLGKEKFPETLLNASINRLRDNGGNPGAQTGANRVDVALHYMYRACLTENYDLLQEAMDYIYSPIALTTGAEGIQYDNSYTQHGRQLYTGSYGRVFLDGITKAAMYAVGTNYEVPSNKLEILSNFVKDSYVNIFRGEYIYFNTIGRASTRPEATKKTNAISIFSRMEAVDAPNKQVYSNIISRLTGEEAPSFGVNPWSVHYYKSDYTLHNKPNYAVDLRLSSTRTVRNEIAEGNGEGLKQYFLSDGATGIFVNGDEYYNIFPVWNWAKIPGVTCPEFTTIPKATSYIKYGESSFAGGVTDSLNAVSTYQYKDTYAGINTSGNKAWFFFDNEVVCLGNNIQSTSGLKVNTTVNQCLLDGDVVVSSNGNQSVVPMGSYDYENNLDWVFHDNVGYFFPESQSTKVNLETAQKSGDWTSINTNYANEPTVTKNVFTLAFDHGTDPTLAEYAYVVVPGLESEAKAKSYNLSNIEIIVNSDSLQAVYHKEQKVYGLVFHKAASFSNQGLAVEVDAGCTMLIKNADQEEAIVHVADPRSSTVPIHIGVVIPSVEEAREIIYSAPSSHLGKSIKFAVNKYTPLYPGKEVALDNSDWIITTSIEGPEDTAVGGTEPKYIIDGNDQTAFLFVKPGKTYGGVTANSDYEPSFTIDMQMPQDFSSFTYRHRTGNTATALRANMVSFYGSNSINTPLTFTPIVENVAIATDVSEVKISFPEVNYRYVKLVITGWYTASGSTIQVSEFNLGVVKESTLGKEHNNTLDLGSIPNNVSNSLLIYPNPVKSGEHVFIKCPTSFKDNTVFEVYDIMGKIMQQKSTLPTINTSGLPTGVYILRGYNQVSGKRINTRFVVR